MNRKYLLLNYYCRDLSRLLKSSWATYPTSKDKSPACDTANEHALTCTRETCSCSQTVSNGTNGDDLYICIATVGNTSQTVNSPILI